ncbi:MAG: EcoKI restriction-modification system protein HsdS [Firmicutes bacterium ADurb.Bin419]|nr:MAG: EcoKI restriction-modification system protein HsdS [Firmicutes bacterium ADurb.Bin419]
MTRESYKETELGIYPDEWEMLLTEDLLINEKGAMKIGPFGSQLKKEYLVDSGFKVYGQESVFYNDYSIGNRFINEERYLQLKSCELLPGDLVITMMGTIGKTAIVPDNIEAGIMDSHLIRLKIDKSKCNAEFIRHSLTSNMVVKQIKKLSVGGIMAGLSSAIIKKLQFVVPPLLEQQYIAEILNKTEEHINRIGKTIEDYHLLKKGMMKKLFTEGIGHTEFKETEIGRIPKTWEVRELSDISEIITGNTPKTSDRENYGNEYIWVSPADLGRKKYVCMTTKMLSKKGFLKTRQLPKGAILVTCIGSTIGKIGILNDTGSTNQQINSMICKEGVYNEYVYYALDFNFEKYTAYISTQAVPIINKTVFSKFKLPIPIYCEQKHIAEVLAELDNRIDLFQQQREDFIQLKKALMEQLLTGKIRVPLS